MVDQNLDLAANCLRFSRSDWVTFPSAMAKDITVEAKMTVIHIPIEGVILTDGFQPFMSNIYRNWNGSSNAIILMGRNKILFCCPQHALVNIRNS